MTYTAKIRRGSAIWKAWRNHHRLRAEYMGIHFTWQHVDYVGTPLNTAQVLAVQNHPDIHLEVITNPVQDALQNMEVDIQEDAPVRRRAVRVIDHSRRE